MNKTLVTAPLSGVHVKKIKRTVAGWEVVAAGSQSGTCPSCGLPRIPGTALTAGRYRI